MSDSNLHTCERAALGWQKDGPCKQCELEDNFAKFGGNFGGKPVPSGTQDERVGMGEHLLSDDLWAMAQKCNLLQAELAAERTRREAAERELKAISEQGHLSGDTLAEMARAALRGKEGE